jgi:dephospho-CoA kinase
VTDRPTLLGITGGIGSGKSTICIIMECLGVPVYYADERAKWLMKNDNELVCSIKNLLGKDSYSPSGDLNRSYIAKVGFGNPDILKHLNQLVHPKVSEDFDLWIDRQTATVVVKEAALLFETGAYAALDHVWLVACPINLRVQRVLKRDPQRTMEDVLAIIDKQMKTDDARKMASLVLENHGKNKVLGTLLKELKAIEQKIG